MATGWSATRQNSSQDWVFQFCSFDGFRWGESGLSSKVLPSYKTNKTAKLKVPAGSTRKVLRVRFLCSIFHPCTRIAKLGKRYHSHVCATSSQFGKEVGNKLVRGRRRNENQTCDSNNCNSRRSRVTGLCPATIGYLSCAWCFGSSYWSPYQ